MAGKLLFILLFLLLTVLFAAACRALFSPPPSSGGLEVSASGSASVRVSHDEESGRYSVEADMDSPERYYPEPNDSDASIGLGPDFWEKIPQMATIADRTERMRIGRTLIQYGYLKVDDLMSFVDRFWQNVPDNDSMPPGAVPATVSVTRPDPVPDRRVIHFSEIPTLSDDFAPFVV